MRVLSAKAKGKGKGNTEQEPANHVTRRNSRGRTHDNDTGVLSTPHPESVFTVSLLAKNKRYETGPLVRHQSVTSSR